MDTVRDIVNLLETYAPPALQESYDNAGLITGSPDETVTGVLICLDTLEEVVDEAIRKSCNLVLAHHPIVFSGLKKINGSTYIERVLIKAIRHNIAIYAAHTNLDNVYNGVNQRIADKLGLVNCRVLSPAGGKLFKLVTFCPESHVEMVRKALFEGGAGNIGNYGECSFNLPGNGTFRANEDANPYVGEKGIRHSEQEQRIEVIFPGYLQERLVQSLLKAHPYEEAAYDIYPLANSFSRAGAGLVGELPGEEDEHTFLGRLRDVFQAKGIRYTNLLGKKVRRVAVCGGSGSFLLKDAIRSGANVFVTADFKYHQFFDAEGKIVIADIGHYESEQFTKDLIYDIITKKNTKFAVHLSEINTNPVNYL